MEKAPRHDSTGENIHMFTALLPNRLRSYRDARCACKLSLLHLHLGFDSGHSNQPQVLDAVADEQGCQNAFF